MKNAGITLRLTLVVLLAFSFLALTEAAERPDKGTAKPQSVGKVTGTPRWQILNINNFTNWLRSDGNGSNPPSSGGDGGYYPRGTRWVIYQDGLVWSGKCYLDAGLTQPAPVQLIRNGGSTYNVGTREGAIVGFGAAATRESPAAADVRIYRIRRDYTEMSDEEVTRDAAETNEIPISDVTPAQKAAILSQYAKDWAEWPVAKGAPYIERNGQPGYQPPPRFSETFTPKDLIEGKYDEPGLAGADPNSPADMVIWTVVNDLDAVATQGLHGSDPMGLEVQHTMWGYKRTDALGQLYFKKSKFINKGGVDIGGGQKGVFYIDSMYVAQWSDPDLGSYGDDLAGCDSVLSLGFVYNGNPIDAEFKKFNLPPPAVGYDFLAGPVVPAPGDSAVFDLRRIYNKKNLGLTSFAYFSAGSGISDPPFSYEGALRWWRMLQGYVPDPSSAPWRLYPHPPGMALTKFPLSGDPVNRTGFNDGIGTDYSFAPGDRRIVLNTGPFTMAPGDTQEVVVGVVGGLGSDRLSSVAVMKFNDRFVQNTYDALFQVPRAPAAPDVKFAELDGEIVLEWGSNTTRVVQTEQVVNQPGDYAFEGYNVYQLPSASSSLSDAVRIATFDLETDPTVILDEQFDQRSGQILQLPVQFGANSGIKRYIRIKRDYIRDIDKLYNGQEYYFAVTAYSHSKIPDYLPTTLESAPQILILRPKVPFGQKINARFADTVKYTHTSGISDGILAPLVMDPTKITGDTYRVTFAADPTDPATFLWTLTNVTKNRVLLANQTNQNDNDLHAIIDGILMKVIGPPVAINRWEFTPSAARWFTGVNWGGEQFFGGLDLGTHFFGSNITPDKYVTVEVRFRTNRDGQRAYRYLRGDPAGSYLYKDYEVQHFTVWDVTSSPPRQLNAAYVEQYGAAAANSLWAPTTSSADREYLFILNSTYRETPDPYYTSRRILQNANEFDVLYAMWPLLRGARTAPEWADGQIFRIVPNFANTDKDVFTINTAPYAPEKSTELEKESANRIGVFPNPYYAFNAAETNRLIRFVTFNNLPPIAKIRIFNLAGQLVRTLEKNDPSQFMRWDLTNDNNFPVASGIYLAHVEATTPMDGSVVTKILKIAVIQEQEILDVY